MRTFIRLFLTLATAGVLVAACASGSTSTPSAGADPTPTATPAPTATPTPTTTPTSTPVPTTDGQGDEYVTGSESILLSSRYTSTKVGDVTRLRGGVLDIAATMNDVRVSGTGTFAFSADIYTKVGSEWGTYHLENSAGAWDGPCTGGTWDAGGSAMWSCWLVGSGDYKGYTYYRQSMAQQPQPSMNVVGIIYPGSPPKP